MGQTPGELLFLNILERAVAAKVINPEYLPS
jgi:hypothetical protein